VFGGGIASGSSQMPLDWKSIRTEHVAEACELVARGDCLPRARAKGIFVVRNGERLPAKQVLRLAYCVAHGLPLGTPLKFASGEGTVTRLRTLGFEVQRL
jgi:hypothetical protein